MDRRFAVRVDRLEQRAVDVGRPRIAAHVGRREYLVCMETACVECVAVRDSAQSGAKTLCARQGDLSPIRRRHQDVASAGRPFLSPFQPSSRTLLMRLARFFLHFALYTYEAEANGWSFYVGLLLTLY